jgi:hypothetical protein
MEPTKSSALQNHRAQLLNALPWADGLVSSLERDGFSITHIRRRTDFAWFVRVCPSPTIQHRFGLAPEVLLLLTRNEVQAKDLQAAYDEIIVSGLRLDANLLIVSDDGKAPLEARLDKLRGPHGFRLAYSQTPAGWPPLVERLGDKLPMFPVFEDRDPVRGTQLIGRSPEVTELRTRVARGDAVALLGLRKMGKTSVMRAVTDALDPASGLGLGASVATTGPQVALVVDAGTILERTGDGLADELLRALRRRSTAAGEPEMVHPNDRGLAGFKRAGERLIDAQRTLCLVIDEYDLLFEGTDGDEQPFADLGRFFRLVRGWAQTYQGAVSMVLVGRDPEYLGRPRLDGVTSPLLAWCTPMWLGPLTQVRAPEILRKLGRRVGLEVGPDSARVAYEWTGGHPLLHRQYGAALQQLAQASSTTWPVATDAYAEACLSAYRERDAVLDVLREVVDLLAKRYPGALQRLTSLATGIGDSRPADGTERMLERCGLVSETGRLPRSVAWYLQTLAPAGRVLRAV